jgi:hypothetical protein
MELKVLIAQTKADCLNLVVSLVTDRHYQPHIRQEIQQRCWVLFEDPSGKGLFQDFLELVARPAAAPPTGAAMPHSAP